MAGKKIAAKKEKKKKGPARKKSATVKTRAARKAAPKKLAKAPRVRASKKNSVKKMAASKTSARKLLTAAPGGKTARNRLAKRMSHTATPPARNMELRTSLPLSGGLRTAKRKPAPAAARSYEPRLLSFREASRKDYPVIGRLLVEAFGRADESDLIEQLRASRDLVAEYVAEYAGQIVAHVAFCKLDISIDDKPVRAAGLAPLAVAGDFERKGVGTRLAIFGLAAIRGLGHHAVFVWGAPEFYGRFGFSVPLAARFSSPWTGPHYLALEFEPGILQGSKGTAVWPSAFMSV